MGIQGLLPLLKSIQKPCSLKQFAGQTVGIDAYGWLHRGTISCAIELATSKPTTKYVDFAMSRVRMLKHFGITPYLVFDGDYLPSKAGTEKERAERRRECRRVGMELLAVGKTAQAYAELGKGVDVTPEMAGLLIEELKRNNIPYVVAPYEADSQMVYLERKGVIDGILSEDSDLLVFGAKTLLTKLDQYGEVVMIRRQDFTSCREVSFAGWSDSEFRHMAILSGCDYLPSIDKMGLKTAYRLLRKHRSVERAVRAVQFEGKLGRVPQGYLEAFEQAERTFLYQWVYCPTARGLVHLTELPDGITAEDLPFIGKLVEAAQAKGVAEGKLHPHTKKPLVLPEVPTTKRWMGPPNSQQPQRRATVAAETPDLKKHKSIDSFFKPARTPLAELDVNLFTGSPHQQEMARRAPETSWPATPVDRGNGAPGSVIARPGTVSAYIPLQARRALSDNASLRRTTSERAPKRQRLCADEDTSPVAQKTTDKVASKFFGGAGPTPSKTPSKRGKSGKAEVNIWSDDQLRSDDSWEEALSQVPLSVVPGQVSGLQVSKKRAKKKIEVFEDGVTDANFDGETEMHSGIVEEETQVTAVSAVFSQPQQAAGPEPDADADADAAPSLASEIDDPVSPFDNALNDDIMNLKSRFAFGSSLKMAMATPPSRIPKPKTRKSPLTRPRKDIRASSPKPMSSSQLDGVHDGPEDPDKLGTNHEEDIVVPNSDTVEPPSPIPTKSGPVVDTGQTSLVGGSEDLLVSESEAEVSEPPTPRPNSFGNLNRFAFAAT